MPAALKRSARDCLICSESTTVAHLGMDVCRACAVFYRRYRTRVNQFACRGNSDCATGKGLNCKRCRLDHLASLLSQPLSVASILPVATVSKRALSKSDSLGQERHLLERLKQAYRSMCYARLSSELYSREEAPHPLKFSLDNIPFHTATLASLTTAIRILLSASINFGNEVFPEFAGLNDEKKWKMVVNFFYRFFAFEGCYRTNVIFPDNPEKKFLVSYASVLAEADTEEFWKSATPAGDASGMLKHAINPNDAKEGERGILSVARFNPCQEEFLAVTALIFLDEANNGDTVAPISEKYRQTIVNELHSFYRDEMKLDDYAARLGELMALLQVFDIKEHLRANFEVMRLIDVMPEDNFVYTLQTV